MVANTDPNGVNPHERITLTFAGIARARLVVVTVAGARQARRAGPHRRRARTCRRAGWPADDLVWLVDADALGDLTPDAVA